MQEVSFHSSKAKYALFLLLAVGFVVIGVLMVREGEEAFWGWANILFFGLCAVWSVREFIRTGPRLTLDEEGVHDRTPGVGVIPWSEIEEAYLVRLNRQPFVCLVLRDPAAYVGRLHPVKRWLSRANGAFGMTELSVNLSGLAEVEPEAVEALILSRLGLVPGAT